MVETDQLTEEELKQSLHQTIDEEFPNPTPLTGEEILNSSRIHNAWIVIGRDRPAGKQSGYGQFPKNKGGDKCSTIDIVVGRHSHLSGKDNYKRFNTVGNNIQLDASRIYISQKTNIDDNFLITKAGTLVPAIGKAAIGLKSDNIRVVARESIKIVAACGEKNSLNNLDQSVKPMYGIQLIAGSETKAKDVQSIVKSENLRECLEDIIKQIDTLAGTLNDYILYQTDFNTAVAKHDHLGHFMSDIAGAVRVVLPEKLPDALTKYSSQAMGKSAINVQSIRVALTTEIKNKYLSKSTNADNYIGSKFNKTN